MGLGFPAPPEPPPAPLARPPPPAAHRAPPAAPPAGAAAAAGLAAAATAAAAPVAPKGRFQRPVTSFFKAPATAEEKQRAAEQQAKEVEASRGKLQESAMEREKRQLEEKEAYRGPGRPKKNRFFSPPAGMCLGVWYASARGSASACALQPVSASVCKHDASIPNR